MNVYRLKSSLRHRLLAFFWGAVIIFTFFANGSLPSRAQAPVYRSVHTEKKQIALTFDDGPHPILTERILDILDRYQAKATFFMVGVNVVHYPLAAKEVLKRGHEIGNHTFSHKLLK